MKIVPDYMEGYLDLERFFYILLVILASWAGYQTLELRETRIDAENRVDNFTRKLPEFQELRKEKLRSGTTKISEEIRNNPLSYLERVVPEKYLTDLEPLDQDSENFRFELKVESTDPVEIVQLLSKFEEEAPLIVTEFTIVRESINKSKFHAIIHLEILS